MATDVAQSDMGIGFAAIFSLLTLGGALVLLTAGLADAQLTAAWGFAAAMVAAAIAVVGTQVYWD
ncbi:DUF7525 family protein [Halegenticoccus soli]|uniref:DUF7525 family protein n=1 Tax=Halegenticoccus soli TaxID=1985678 RepID=UPI000C6D7C06|nr:hypothetical protein [Halegenticoccus soli]